MAVTDNMYMKRALDLAEEAAAEGEVPVGAVIVRLSDGRIVGEGRNRREKSRSPLAHAELEAIENASRFLGGWRLSGCEMYVTLEPCPMCAGAIAMARLGEVVFGAYDERAGCCGSLYALTEDAAFGSVIPCSGGLLEEECRVLLERFFAEKRA